MIPVIYGIAIALGAIFSASSCGNGENPRPVTNGRRDGSGGEDANGSHDAADATDVPPTKKDAGPRDAGKDSGHVRDASDDHDAGTIDGGRDSGTDAGRDAGHPDSGLPIIRRGINDNFAKIPCDTLADLDIIGDKLFGLCRTPPLSLFKCQTTTHLESSLCQTVVELPDTVNDRAITPTAHYDIGNGQSLISFSALGAESGIGVFTVNRDEEKVELTYGLHRATYISAGGNIDVTPMFLYGALISQNQLFLATQSYYDVSGDGSPATLGGQIIALPFISEGIVDTDFSHANLLAAGQEVFHLSTLNDNALLAFSNDAGASVREINSTTPPSIFRTDSLGDRPFKTLPNLAHSEDGALAVTVSAQAPWQISVIDLVGRRSAQTATLENITGIVSSIVLSGTHLFVTDSGNPATNNDGQILWMDFTRNVPGAVLKRVAVGQEAGPSAIYDGILYQSISANQGEAPGANPKLVAVDPLLLE
ncbi:MAG: hypothetical protein Q7T03_05610 [Deltaproteobacteria bacterium]|nr:hypothetical protein [Deltaproteobacteria bacterium]